MARMSTVMALLLVVGACGDGDAATSTTESVAAIEARIRADVERLVQTPEPMRSSIRTWYNSTALPQLSPAVWQARLDRACNERFWEDPSVLEQLGDEFVAADAPLAHPLNDPASIVPEDAYVALWTMALNHCRALVPDEAVEAGPPHMNRRNG